MLPPPGPAIADPEPGEHDPEAEPGEHDPEAEPETGPLRRCIVTRQRLAKERMIRFVLGPDRGVVPDLAARLPGRGIWLSARGDVLETARAQGSLARAFARQASRDAPRGDGSDVPADAGSDAANTLAKAGRGSVTLPPDLNDRIEAMLLRRVVELLGLARRAGQAVCGFQKAREWLTSNRAGLVLQASDGSVDERARFLSGVKALDLGADGDLSVNGGMDAARPGDAAPDEEGAAQAVPQGIPTGIPVGAPLSAAALGAVFGRDHVVHVVVAPGRLAELLANEIARLSGVTRRAEPGRPPAKAGPGTNAAKAGPKAAGGNAGKIEAGRTGQDRDLNKRAGA